MATISFALSVHHYVTSVGAYAGLAAIVGLAILVLLLFSQARETSSLRRRAEDAEQELQRQGAYLEHLHRRGVGSAPAPAATPAPASASVTGASLVAPAPAAARRGARPVAAPTASRSVSAPPALAGAVAPAAPAAPAGVGAPALSSATRLIPIEVLDDDPISVGALRPSHNGEVSDDDGSAIASPSPPPSTAAAGGNGAGHHDPAAVTAPVFAGPATVAPPPRVASRGSGGSPGRPAPPLHREPPSGGGGRPVGRIVAALIAALAVAAVVVVVLVVTSSGKNSSASSSTAASKTTAKAGRHHQQAAGTRVAVTPSAVTVAVLNGTSTANLAHDVMQKLTGLGYKQGAIQTASNQSLDSTIVGYLQPADRADALAVAKSLDLGSASVQGVAASDRSVACSATPTNCPAQVVVTVGADLASAA